MILNLALDPLNWSASSATLTRRHPEGWSLPPDSFVLAAWASGAGKIDALSSVISGLVALGEASGWEARAMLICESGTVPVMDGEEQIGTRKVLELAVTLIARPDHPDASVRGLTKPDTWSSESLPVNVRDALLECWEALQ